jgi:hypothetical protein
MELEKMATDPETAQIAREMADEVSRPEHPDR